LTESIGGEVRYVMVSFDDIRNLLPEYQDYENINPDTSGEMTQKESGYIGEILQEAAMRKRCNVIIDGTLSNSKWYIKHIHKLRESFPHYDIGILYVTAPPNMVQERILQRHRKVPSHIVQRIQQNVPQSMTKLSHRVDIFFEVRNAEAPVLRKIDVRDATCKYEVNEKYVKEFLQGTLQVRKCDSKHEL